MELTEKDFVSMVKTVMQEVIIPHVDERIKQIVPEEVNKYLAELDEEQLILRMSEGS